MTMTIETPNQTVEVINNQRKTKINRRIFQEFAETLGIQIFEIENKPFTIAFVSDKKMRELNLKFRGKDKTTDVLSFPYESDEFDFEKNRLGDIVISTEQAVRQAGENDLDFETEIKQLILHGVLHLAGYDHETDGGEMNRREIELREKLSIS
jgi:rRNA maturation RNase YbeY